MDGLWGIRGGLDLDNLEETTPEEIDTFLARIRTARGALNSGPIYEMNANSLWLYTRPDVAKRHMRFNEARPDEIETVIAASSAANLHTYFNQNFETGIQNCARGMQMRDGFSKAQVLEVIMHAQLTGGMRGLGATYNALGNILSDWQDRPGGPTWPEGWAPDMDAFTCGLDMSTREYTDGDRAALHNWYLETIGEIPMWVTLMERHDSRSLKAYRAKWEGTFQGALPKQMMPYLSIRHYTVMGSRDGLREAALLGKAWGITDAYIWNTILQGAYYFTGIENLGFIGDSLDDVLTGD